MSILKRIEQNNQPQIQADGQPGSNGSKFEELRLRKQATAPLRDAQRELRERVHSRLIAELDPKLDVTKTDEVRKNLESLFAVALEEENIPLNRADKAKLFVQIVADILGYGPIEPRLAVESITESTVNFQTYVSYERK